MKRIIILLFCTLTIALGQIPNKLSTSVSITLRVFAIADFSPAKNYAVALYDSSGIKLDSLVAVDTNVVSFSNVIITGVVSSNETPTGYLLEQNYPNPFNPSSKIKFTVPQAGPVSLITYTILGQEDASLDMNLEPGNYEVQYEPGRAAGVIFYRLVAKNFTQTKKMIQFGGKKMGNSRLHLLSSTIQSRSQQSRLITGYVENTFTVKLYNLPSTSLPIKDTTFQIVGLNKDTTVDVYADLNPQVTADDLIINEVFNIPADKHYAYSWIEIFNPTNRYINLSNYILQMKVQRKKVYYDPQQPIDFVTNPNPDFVTQIDTEFISYSTEAEILFYGDHDSIPPKGFVIITNDSANFWNYSNLGPGQTTMFDFPYLLGYDTSATEEPTLNAFYRWYLLDEGEIRLMKIDSITTHIRTSKNLSRSEVLLDLVRYGNYRQIPDIAPQNIPATFIPEWWSLARYANILYVNPTTESTSRDFYRTNNPIPGWFSQQRR